MNKKIPIWISKSKVAKIERINNNEETLKRIK
jgi:hypothetical protein